MTKVKRPARVFYNSPGDKEVMNQAVALDVSEQKVSEEVKELRIPS